MLSMHSLGFGKLLRFENEDYVIVGNCGVSKKTEDGVMQSFYFGIKKSDTSPAPTVHLVLGPSDLHLRN